MPTYEYACKGCGEHLEVVQSFKDEALTVCPACGGPLRKVFGNIGITFKGSGFYRTDNASGHRTAASKAAGEAAKTTDSKSAEGSTGDGAKSVASADASPKATSTKETSGARSAAAAGS
jgi:putative FmdB family regulatory protein